MTALLAPAALLVALVLAVQFVHVQLLPLCAVDRPHREAGPLPHHVVVAVAARHRTPHVTKSGIVGQEDATVAVHLRVVDASAHQRAAVLRVEARTRPVADAARARVAVEGIAPSRANGLHRAGEGARGTGARVEVGVGAQRMAGAPKGRLVGVEAGQEARVRAGPYKKVGAKHEILALRTVLLQGSRSRDRPRPSGRETRWSLRTCVVFLNAWCISCADWGCCYRTLTSP